MDMLTNDKNQNIYVYHHQGVYVLFLEPDDEQSHSYYFSLENLNYSLHELGFKPYVHN